MLKFNEKYNRWFSDEGEIFSFNAKLGKLVKVKGHLNSRGYISDRLPDRKMYLVHRAIWETFNGEIPEGMVIDHLNTNRSDNRLDNLNCCTYSENSNNPNSVAKMKETLKEVRKPLTDFGTKFKEHFGIRMCENRALYNSEWRKYKKLGKCSWEV